MTGRRRATTVARDARRSTRAGHAPDAQGARGSLSADDELTRASLAGAVAPLALGPTLTIAEVRDCHRSLIAMLEHGHALADGSALSSVDTAGLQLLLAAGRAAQARGLKLRLNGAEELLRGHAMVLGLDTDLTEVVELTP